MFPTGVGMNRHLPPTFAGSPHVPHRRGDEPVTVVPFIETKVCSPQAWG